MPHNPLWNASSITEMPSTIGSVNSGLQSELEEKPKPKAFVDDPDAIKEEDEEPEL